MLFAIDAARKLGDEQGQSTQVCIMDEQGQPERTSGQDAYPRRDMASLAS
jgi:hypothetical protein